MITVFQHHDSGTPGRLGTTLRDHGFKLDIRRPDRHADAAIPPDLDNVQGVIILGGPQNVTDIDKHTWMQKESAFIKAAHAQGLPIIGICLGAQLIAHTLGGKVLPREKPALGFHPLSLNTTGQIDSLLAGVPWNSPQVFSCGQEVKELPPGATLLAGTKAIPVQVYRVGLRTYGYLCHFECDRPGIDTMMAESKRGVELAGTTLSEIKVQADQEYDRYARVSDRMCVNIAAYCFPLQQRASA